MVAASPNLSPSSPPRTRERVARQAGLAPDVLQQGLSDTGAGVSAGQRRRIGLARVLLRSKPLVLLDEPSASLDSHTEQVVADVITKLRAEGRTVVMVAHRPALVTLADQIVHLEPVEQISEQNPSVTSKVFRFNGKALFSHLGLGAAPALSSEDLS